jgi:hypothetical protein
VTKASAKISAIGKTAVGEVCVGRNKVILASRAANVGIGKLSLGEQRVGRNPSAGMLIILTGMDGGEDGADHRRKEGAYLGMHEVENNKSRLRQSVITNLIPLVPKMAELHDYSGVVEEVDGIYTLLGLNGMFEMETVAGMRLYFLTPVEQQPSLVFSHAEAVYAC